MKGFIDLTDSQLIQILNTAMDTGDWHVPHASNIIRNKLYNSSAAYGTCLISKHNHFRDVEHWFTINRNTVHIWKERPRENMIAESLYRPIYNLGRILKTIQETLGENVNDVNG